MCAEAVVQCVEGGCEWCSRLMIRTSLSSPTLLSPLGRLPPWPPLPVLVAAVVQCVEGEHLCCNSGDHTDASVLTDTTVTSRPSATAAI